MENTGSSKQQKTFPDEVFLNGKWLPHAEAFISVFDRGFMLGDGIYEVIPVYSGKPFMLQEHLERLQYCLNEVNIEYKASTLKEPMLEAISRAGLGTKDAAIYIQLTRGVAPRTHYYPENSTPTVLLYTYPVNLDDTTHKEYSILVTDDKRWSRCDIKSIALMANTMANEQAVSAGYDENLLVRRGYFTEGSHTSAFFVKNETVHTHPKNECILGGVTRKLVIDMCAHLNIKLKEEPVHLDELVEVDELFLTGTTTQIVAVTTAHSLEKQIYSARKNTITRMLQEEFLKRTRG